MTLCYFPSQGEGWVLRWNVTAFRTGGGSVATPFSSSVYAPSPSPEEVRAELINDKPEEALVHYTASKS